MPLLALALGFLGVASAGVSYAQTKSAQKKAKQAAKRNEGLLINSEGTADYIPVIYGTRRVAGTRVFVATNDVSGGDPNEFLYLVYVLCEGEVDDITDILIDDLPTSDARFAYTDSIAINKFYGTDVQTADATFIAANIGWTSDHTLKGLTYITVRLKWNKDAFSSIPNITALVRGKKVYDPRTTLTAYSTNPALCIRDYLTNTRYGKGLDAAEISDTSIIAAADFYDTTVTFWTSGTVGKLFEFNAVIDTEKTILDNLKDMLLCCRGFLPYTNGLYELIPDKSASSSFAFTTSNIIGGISIKGESKADKYNRVICNFNDPENNWQENTAIWPDSGSAEETAFLAEDGGTELVGDFELPCITNYYAARDLARVFLLRSRNAIRTSFSATSDALNLTVGDVVTVTHPTPAWSAKPFQVEEVTINYDGTCNVSLIEYDSSIYTYDPASEQLAYSDTDLPNPFAVGAPTGFVATESTILSEDGSVVREITITWTAAADAFVESYELQFKLSAASVYFSVFTEQPRYITTYGAVGEVYDYRIRSINSLGVVSDWLTGTYTTVGDTTAPAIPTGVTISGDYNQVTATWSAATERDYKESWVYQNTTGVTPSTGDTPFLKVTGNTVTVAGLAVSTTYYVWVRNVDFSGNVSGFSSAGTFTTTAGAAAASVIAGGTIAGSVTTDGVQISTVRTNAALATTALQTADFNTTLETRLASGSSVVMSALGGEYVLAVGTNNVVAKHTLASEAGVAPYPTGTLRTGLIVTANGIAMGYNDRGTGAWITAVSITSTGSIAIRGDISAASGTFAGSLITGGQILSTGQTTISGQPPASIIGNIGTIPSGGGSGLLGRAVGNASSSADAIGVSGVAVTAGGLGSVIGVQGYADGTNGIGLLGDAPTGIGVVATGAVALSANGPCTFFGGNVSFNDNLLVGSVTSSGSKSLILGNGSTGSAQPNQIVILSQDSGDSKATLHLVAEETVVAGTGVLSGLTSQIKIRINGVEYWLPIVPV